MAQVVIREREAFSIAELADLLAWLEAAWDDPPGSWSQAHWQQIGPGPHFLIYDERGGLAAHACIGVLDVEAAELVLRTGYVEDVATRVDMRGHGLATALMRELMTWLRSAPDLELAALSTGSHRFYESFGWERWRGPSAVTEPNGSRTPTPDEDGGIMIARLPRTPSGLVLDGTICRARRDDVEAW